MYVLCNMYLGKLVDVLALNIYLFLIVERS